MKYIIPVENIDKLEKKAKHIANKGVKVIFEIGNPVYVENKNSNYNNLYHKCYEVEADGEYKINGWIFVATIEHTANGNIIRKAVNVEVPERYKTTTPECEHCHTIRDRKDTYLVYNEKENEFKQVGKSCLQSYTSGLSVNVCAELASFIEEMDKSQDEFDMFGSGIKSNNYLSADKFKKLAYEYVKKNGYVSKSNGGKTVDILHDMYFSNDKFSMANDNEIEEIDKWVDTVDTHSNDYFYNAVTTWKLDYIEPRHFSLIASLINTYFKDLQRKREIELTRQNSKSEYVGNVGDKINLNVDTFKVLYTKDGGAYGYNASDSYVYRIVDQEGNVFIWSTTKKFLTVDEYNEKLNSFDKEYLDSLGYLVVTEGTTILATIKGYKEYNGEKQTVITRGKIVESMSVSEALEALKNQ